MGRTMNVLYISLGPKPHRRTHKGEEGRRCMSFSGCKHTEGRATHETHATHATHAAHAAHVCNAGSCFPPLSKSLGSFVVCPLYITSHTASPSLTHYVQLNIPCTLTPLTPLAPHLISSSLLLFSFIKSLTLMLFRLRLIYVQGVKVGLSYICRS